MSARRVLFFSHSCYFAAGVVSVSRLPDGLVEQADARVIPLPPSSPDLSPIEEMLSKVKGSLRSAAKRTTDTLTTAIGDALRDVKQQDIEGWFKSRATYAMQP